MQKLPEDAGLTGLTMTTPTTGNRLETLRTGVTRTTSTSMWKRQRELLLSTVRLKLKEKLLKE